MRNLLAYLVEDNERIRENLIGTLENHLPISVVGIAEDEDLAVRWLKENRADIVLIDLFLRSGSGLGVLEALQKLPPTTAVVITNYATPTVRRRCAELGAARIFDKYQEIDALVDFCSELAEQTDLSIAVGDPPATPN